MTEIKFSMLEVDLGKETSRVVDVTEDVKKYLGARGLGRPLGAADIVLPLRAAPMARANVTMASAGRKRCHGKSGGI
jgi:aldehyde:ferredoxin oxidoreductase